MPIETNHRQASLAIARAGRPLKFGATDYDSLLHEIGSARVVLIGEASHGTHEFYRERARITQRLIAEKGFCGVAAEADWPDAWRLNRFCQHEGTDQNAAEALGDFLRFPSWMWRNHDVADFAEWLRAYNRENQSSAGFYGLDLYSLSGSAQAVLQYLDRTDPEAATRARFRYSCFEHFGEDPQAYGYAASFDMDQSCEQGAIDQLLEMERKAKSSRHSHARRDRESIFSAAQNARLVRDAEQYYRTMFDRRANSWNLRDTHMADTLDALLEHLGPDSRIVVWAHNSHVGDARATQMGARGELNVGQLVRQRYGSDCYIIGFTTYEGEVRAASDWDQPGECKRVRPALDGSYEALFHESGMGDFLLHLRSDDAARQALMGPMLERAIGVVYHPHTERVSHYFHTRLPEQFDAILHIDRTEAVVPLEDNAPPWAEDALHDAPETFPFAV